MKERHTISTLLFILLSVNIGLGFYNYILLKKKKPADNIISGSEKYYDQIAPNFKKSVHDGSQIDLLHLKGNIIILRFSNFDLIELPDLVYIEHLSKRYNNLGLSLIFINTLGIHDKIIIEKYVLLDSPIIEDDGSIAASYRMHQNGTIIIGKDFKIKYKSFNKDKNGTYNFLENNFINKEYYKELSHYELKNIINKVAFRDIKNGNIKIIKELINNKTLIINIATSACVGCPEGKRLQILKDMSQYDNQHEYQVILLFGCSNKKELLNEYLEIMQLQGYPIDIGIIEKDKFITNDEYYKIFGYDTDPKLIAIDKSGSISFVEKKNNTQYISIEYLLNMKKQNH
jgi:hypothetical protein